MKEAFQKLIALHFFSCSQKVPSLRSSQILSIFYHFLVCMPTAWYIPVVVGGQCSSLLRSVPCHAGGNFGCCPFLLLLMLALIIKTFVGHGARGGITTACGSDHPDNVQHMSHILPPVYVGSRECFNTATLLDDEVAHLSNVSHSVCVCLFFLKPHTAANGARKVPLPKQSLFGS